MAQPSDVNVDDLRRRARRRLVGAIVLALSAAVFVPMLLESEPKPLGEDVSVKIPPVDNGKFVNKLNAKGGGDAAKAPARSEPARVETPKPETTKSEPMKAEPAAAQPATSSMAAPTPSSGNAATPAAADATPAAPKRSLAEAEQKVLSPSAKAPTAVTPPVPKAPAAPAATVAPAPAPAAVEAPRVEPAKPEPAKESPKPAADASGFSVQLAAFSDDKGANSLANKLKKAGYAAYTEPLTTSSGTQLWRVRVGPFATRDAAGAVRDKLKGDGYIGIVAPAK